VSQILIETTQTAAAELVEVFEPGPQGPPGPRGLTHRRAWVSTTAYAVDDAVSSGGSSWRAIRANTGVTPVEGLDWTILAEKATGVDATHLGGRPSADFQTIADANVAYLARALADAKGDLIAATGADAFARLPVGTNGQALVADSAATAGVKWGDVAATTVVIGAGALAAAVGAPALAPVATNFTGWLLDAASTESVSSQTLVPPSWATMNVECWYTNPGTGTGNVVLRSVLSAGGGLTDGETLGTGSLANVTNAAPAQNVLRKVTVAAGVGAAAGELQLVNVERIGADAGDTLPNDIAVLAIVLRRAS
jgi:hypothetical protein